MPCGVRTNNSSPKACRNLARPLLTAGWVRFSRSAVACTRPVFSNSLNSTNRFRSISRRFIAAPTFISVMNNLKKMNCKNLRPIAIVLAEQSRAHAGWMGKRDGIADRADGSVD